MATRNRQRGQSLVELAFITPLLAILIAGGAEVGWYTNRWLTLLEVTRVGARSATFYEGDLSPLQWPDLASVAPDIQTGYMGVVPSDFTYLAAQNARDCETNGNFGFYTRVMCTVESSLDPLSIRMNGTDDIVISVFAIQPVNNARYVGYEANNEGTGNRPKYKDLRYTSIQDIDPDSKVYKITYDLNDAGGQGQYASKDRKYPPGRQNVVVGRYPANANECTDSGTPTTLHTLEWGDPGYEKDPFDYLNQDDGDITFRTWGDVDYYLELRDPDQGPLSDAEPEFQRGFSTTGQHQISDPNVFCFGSEFSIRDVEELVNMPNFIKPDLYNPPTTDTSSQAYHDWVDDEVYGVDPDLSDTNYITNAQEERAFFEPQGITLIEIFWHHDLLLNFALFRPLQDTFSKGEIVIALWSAFPLPSVAPNITYQLP
jgi:hypothetical protein